MKRTFKTIAVAAVATLICSCASQERHIKDIAVSPSPTDNPSEAIAGLEQSVNQSREAGVGVLSPTWFASAERSLADAKRIRDKGGNFTEIFEEVAEGRAQLDRAQQVAKVSEKMLQDVLIARNDALGARTVAKQAGATKLVPLNKEVASAEEKLLALTRAVENDELSKVEEQKSDVLKEYRALEVAAVTKEKLDPARRVLQEARNADADDYAPKSFAYAEEVVKATETFIEGNPKATKEIDAKSEEATFYARRALNVAQQAKQFDERTPEDSILWIEQNVSGLGTVLGSKDVRDITLEQQFAVIKDRLKSPGATTALVTAAEKAQTQFRANEAEVLTDGNRLIIRAKGIRFAPGKADLEQANTALLEKIANVIAMYPAAEVTVEGHTDSSGSAEVNQKLSEERALSIKEYLVSNDTLTEERVQAVGSGSSKPISSNKTRAGRAANRRIDFAIVLPSTPATSTAE